MTNATNTIRCSTLTPHHNFKRRDMLYYFGHQTQIYTKSSRYLLPFPPDFVKIVKIGKVFSYHKFISQSCARIYLKPKRVGLKNTTLLVHMSTCLHQKKNYLLFLKQERSSNDFQNLEKSCK